MTTEDALPEKRLMQAVILHALADAMGNNTFGREAAQELDKERAFNWFDRAGADFQAVCELAGLSPSHVRRYALAFIATESEMPRLRRDAYKPTRNPLSINSIAAHAGVSPSATRAALKRKQGSPAMLQRVRRAHAELIELHGEAA